MVITDILGIQRVNHKKNLDINPGLDSVLQQLIPLHAASLHQIENNFKFQPSFGGRAGDGTGQNPTKKTIHWRKGLYIHHINYLECNLSSLKCVYIGTSSAQ